MELKRILKEYEELLIDHHTEANSNAVNVLLNDELLQFEQSLISYPKASVSALRGLASSEAGNILRQKMGKNLYQAFCKMLEQMVTFCNLIKHNERYILELNTMRWKYQDTTDVPIEVIKDAKDEYEKKLQNLKEGILLKCG